MVGPIWKEMQIGVIEVPTRKTLLVQKLEEQILSGKLRVGDSLPSERQLQEETHISKTVIHAACHHWFPGLYYNHTTSAYLKSTLVQMWELEPEVLDETCRCRFREKTNVNQYLFKFWQLVTGQFYPQKASLTKCYHMRLRNVPQVCRDIREKTYAVLCLNDIGEIPDITETVESIRDAFEAVLPNKCSFEKDR